MAYRQRKEQSRQTNDMTFVDDRTLAELEQEIARLKEQLNVEERFRTDVQVRHFKVWLRTHLQPHDSTFAKRFLADSKLPQHASRSLYEAKLRLHGYSAEDIHLFQDTWKMMLFEQS